MEQSGIELAAPLLAWYDKHARVLPWREQPSPYRVWVSEIMLQQTRVEAVIPYYLRFIEALPSVVALARCPEEQLLKLWEGLGYYNRVRNMQKAAKLLVERYNGEMPANYDELLTLPGIGEYTAGAVASIVYQIPVPAADGNVFRVLTRLMAYSGDIAEPSVRRELRAFAQELLPHDRPGAFNQALMELGATVCIPNGAPLCDRCPVSHLCASCAQQTQMQYPVKKPKKARRVEQRTVIALVCGDHVCLQKRPAKGLLAGLWEFFNIEQKLTRPQLEQLLGTWTDGWNIVKKMKHKHIFTHVEWHMDGYIVNTDAMPDVGQWVQMDALKAEYALPGAFEPIKKEVIRRWEAESIVT